MATGEFAKHPHSSIYHVLFLDDDNSCASQMAEAIGQSLNIPKFIFKSAGITASAIDPMTIDFLQVKGMDVSKNSSKTLEHLGKTEPLQVIVTLSPTARNKIPPRYESKIILDWQIKNPNQRSGKAAQIHNAYEEAFQALKSHIEDLVQAIAGQNQAAREVCA